MVKVPKDKATPEFKAAVSRFEQSLSQAGADLVGELMSQGWTQGEAEGFFVGIIKEINFNFPEKGKDEVPDEFLYGSGGQDDVEN